MIRYCLRKNKKNIIILMVFILIVQMIQVFALGNKTFADDSIEDFPFITDISLTDENGASYDLGTKEFEKNANIRINYKFQIPSGQQIEIGKKYKITIPEEFMVNEVTTGAAVTTGPAAGIESDNNNDLIVTFNEQKDIDSQVSGGFYIDVAFNPDKIGDVTTKNITFTENSINLKEFLVKFINEKEIQFPFITGLYLSDKDFTGDFALDGDNFETNYSSYLQNHLNKVEFQKDSQMYIGYKFTIPQNQVITKGQKFTVNIPNEFAKIIENTAGISLIADAGTNPVNIGTVTYSTDNKATIEFSDACSGDHSEVVGNFWFGRKFNESEIGDENPVSITFNTAHYESKIFKFNFYQTPFVETEPTITKTGEYSVQDQVINWKIVVDAGNLDRTDVSIIDNLDKVKNKFKSGSLKVDGAVVNDSYFLSDDLTYNIQNLASEEKKTIEFQTEPSTDILDKQGTVTNISNTATLKMDGKADKNCTTTVGVKNDFIYKQGNYNQSTKNIDWTIKVNTSKINFENPIITDDLPENLALIKNTVTTDAGVSIKVTTDAGASIDGSQIIYNETSRKFEYKLPSDSNQHIIKFSTSIDPSVFQNTFKQTVTFKNSVKLDVNNKSYSYESQGVNVGVGGEVLTKSAVGYDKATKEITWKIVVDSIGITIGNADAIAKITEFIDSNQEYVPGSISCDKKLDIAMDEVTAENPTKYPKQYEVSLGTVTEPYTITLKTKVINNSTIYGNSVNYCNNICKLTGGNIKDYTATATQAVDSKLIQKDGTYNYNTREITWSIIVNASQTPINDVKIIDAINDGQEYLDNSFSITRSVGNGDAELTSEAINNGFSYIPKSSNDLGQGGSLSYSFDGTIKDSYKITFKTKIAYDSEFSANNDKIVTNEAKFLTSETAQEIKSSKDITINNYMVQKDYQYTSGNDFITWKININKNNVPLDGMKVTDKIPDGLQIDMDSAKLYEVQFDTNGNAISVNNKEVPSNEYTTSYDITSRNFVLEDLNSTNKSYLLQFDTLVKASGSSFANNVIFEDNEKTYTSVKQSSKVQFEDNIYGGSASTFTGTIAIKKVDQDNINNTLSGAKFALIRNGNILQVSEPTGSDGKAIFKRLKFGTEYSIKEVEAPYGYKLNDEEYNFTITKDEYNHNVKDYTFANQKIKKSIELLKRSSNGDPLKGTEFKLYLASDTTLNNPIKTSTSDEDGIVRFDGISQGQYIIKESMAPKGYILLPETIKIQATVDGSGHDGDTVKASPYEITNEYIKKTIQLSKQSEESVPLEGATFALYKETDAELINPLKMAISDEHGLVSFENIDYGSYIIKEVNAPQGYDLSNKLIHVSEDDFIKNETSTILFGTITNSKTKVEVRKIIEFYKKSLDLTPLSGAIFTLYSEDDDKFQNSLATTVSDLNGLVKFNNILQGNYKIKETKAPDGYNLADTIIHVKDSEFNEEESIKTNPYTIIDQLITSIGTVKDEKGQVIKGIETKLITETDGTKTVSVKSEEAILFKQPDGTTVSLGDSSNLGFSSTGNSNVVISDGNIKIKNLENGTEETINVTFDLGNGQKIIIGTIDIKVSANGDVSFISQLIDPYGIVTDSVTGKIIDGANLTLYYADTNRNKTSGKIPGKEVSLPIINGFKPNNNINPQISDASGAYGFMVFPTSDYYIVVTKAGYKKYTSPTISVEQDIVKFDLKMDKLNGGSNSNQSNTNSSLSKDEDKKDQEITDEKNTEKNNDNISENTITDIIQNMNSIDEFQFKEDASYENSNLNNKGQNKLLPQAGRFIDFTVLMSFGILLILLGIAYKLRKKFLIR